MIHYLDDVLFLGPPNSGECRKSFLTALATCNELGVPVAVEKLEGPTTCVRFLGIELNSLSMSLKLPERQMASLKSGLASLVWAKCVCDLHQLQSLIGHLVHACQVLPLGKAFLNHLFHLANSTHPGHTRRLNCLARADITWWQIMCDGWSGILFHQFLQLHQPAHHLFTDASGTWGCGVWSAPFWFNLQWSEGNPLHSIVLKELFPVVLACAGWGRRWTVTYIPCHSDNVAAVSQVNRLHARDHLASHLLRCLALFMAKFDFSLRAVHIAGRLNTGADYLSRGRVQPFVTIHSSASHFPTQVPQELVDMLLCPQHEWTSPSWRQLYSSFWRRV